MTKKVKSPVQSAGLLMCRKNDLALEFFLIHPGGPFWAKKDIGAWSIPKGLTETNELVLETATREFFEETGIRPVPPFHSLDTVTMKSGKVLHAWTFLGEWTPEDGFMSNTISIEFPPRSNKFITVPEADKGEWMDFEKAIQMIIPVQRIFLERAATYYASPQTRLESC